ncbi:MAG: TdeIII family type II restriction endonuclease [Candidatus Cloacimonetes bacterium]|nr:TdeIII family type II restriction endonuclease [Candidatus Cloacimonadota bacterium]
MLTQTMMTEIEKTIEDCLLQKFDKYNPETVNMPFHYRLLGKDRMALFSFIQSLNTTFGTSIYEPVSTVLASLNGNFVQAQMQYKVGKIISEAAQIEIQNIIDELSAGNDSMKEREISRIRKVCRNGKGIETKPVKVDLFLEDKEGVIHLFDLKTVKPNKSNFKDFKRTLLEWVAISLYNNPNAEIYSYIAIPYNPYEPKPYERWTMKGMLDLSKELKVAEEFWDFLAGENTYNELLGCFERVGIKMRPVIDQYFKRFK